MHPILESNLARSLGYSSERTWFPERDLLSQKASFFNDFFNQSEWQDWIKAIQDASTRGFLSRFISHEEQGLNDSATKMYTEIVESDSFRPSIPAMGTDREEESLHLDKISRYKKLQQIDTQVYNLKETEQGFLTNLKEIGKLWYKSGLNLHQRSRDEIFVDAFSMATELIMLENNMNQTEDLCYELITCRRAERIMGIALMVFTLNSDAIELSFLATDPRNIDHPENAEQEKIRGIGTVLLYEVLQRCLEHQRNLKFHSYPLSLSFYRRFKLADKCPYNVVSLEKIQSAVQDFPLPREKK